LYLLDAFNEGSEADIVEYAGVSQAEKERGACWKANLEDILLRFGEEHPAEFLDEIFDHFAVPASRLQLLMLLNIYTSNPSFRGHVEGFAQHALLGSITTSLLLDNSSTVCEIGLTLLAKLLPMMAIHACDDLKRNVPTFLAILARTLCWKQRDPPSTLPDETRQELETKNTPLIPPLMPSPDLKWSRLEHTFTTTSVAPSPWRCVRLLLCLLY
jgi:hypothetical protein